MKCQWLKALKDQTNKALKIKPIKTNTLKLMGQYAVDGAPQNFSRFEQ
jgi:hypothetical protein